MPTTELPQQGGQVVRGRHIVIVGAGLGGALMACYLGRAGFRVGLYERRPDPRVHGFSGGRSINLALSARGILGLRGVGLDQLVLQQAIAMRGRMIHPRSSPDASAGDLAFQPYSKISTDAIHSVSRAGLNIALLDAAARFSNVSLLFDQRCLDVELDRPAAEFVNEKTGERRRVECDAVIGADGAYSAVRLAMQKSERFNFSQDYLGHGYRELTIPPAAACGVDPAKHDGFAMEPNALHIWPRGGSMMIALPNPDRSFTCTLFWPYQGEISFGAIRGASDVQPFFRKHFPDAVPLMPTLVDDYMQNPVGSLVTMRCAPWHHGGKVVLLGDAAHAIVPFFGQGMNAAFEDCVALDECLRRHSDDFDSAFEAYFRDRKENADAIAEMALDNFIEMRDKTASRLFRAGKHVEKTLNKWFPQTFRPLYNMISFSTIPYAEARRRARWQSRITVALAAAATLLLIFLIVIAAFII